MSTRDDIIGVARDHRWMRAAEQEKQLKAAGCRAVLTLGDWRGHDNPNKHYQFEDLLRLVRPGRVVQLMYIFLLAAPKKKGEVGRLRREAFDRALHEIVDKRKGIVRDVPTGLSTETKAQRQALTALAYDQMSRSNRGLFSSENGKRNKGRPLQWADPAHRQIIWEEWHSSAHATNTDAANEASRRIGKRITHYSMWRIVKEMREAKGLKGAGASGRRPSSAAAQLAALVGKPDPTRPLPKARVRRGVVYFLQNGVPGRVKIGFTEDLKGRLSALQGATSDAVTLIGTIPGPAKLERKMHKRFDAHRMRREWFKIEGNLAAFLKATFPKSKVT